MKHTSPRQCLCQIMVLHASLEHLAPGVTSRNMSSCCNGRCTVSFVSGSQCCFETLDGKSRKVLCYKTLHFSLARNLFPCEMLNLVVALSVKIIIYCNNNSRSKTISLFTSSPLVGTLVKYTVFSFSHYGNYSDMESPYRNRFTPVGNGKCTVADKRSAFRGMFNAAAEQQM